MVKIGFATTLCFISVFVLITAAFFGLRETDKVSVAGYVCSVLVLVVIFIGLQMTTSEEEKSQLEREKPAAKPEDERKEELQEEKKEEETKKKEPV